MKNKLFLLSFLIFIMLLGTDSIAQIIDGSSSTNVESFKEGRVRPDSLENQNDSLEKWKSNREFNYMNYLDSLLKKSDLRADTISINELSGKINRSPQKSADFTGLNNFLNSFPLKVFFWMMAIIFIGFILYKIILKNGILGKRRLQSVELETMDSLAGLDEYLKYDSLISEAESQMDYNLSTRYWYLKTLKNLSDKELIHYAPDKTNNEYLIEMSLNTYYRDFALLTRNYEYVWYGKFKIDKNKYEPLKQGFILFNKKI